MENEVKSLILSEVAAYYSKKLIEHGATPNGVDWNGLESQKLRFNQLCKIIDKPDNYSINDLGCGYGAMYEFLLGTTANLSYCGIDVSEKMIEAARQRTNDQARFIVSDKPDRISDYGVASGIFNVRLASTDEDWQSYIEATLDILDQTSRLGFSFNCLTSYSDPEKMRKYLYYADPCKLFDFCKRHYSRNVALLHDYGLYEFTILVRKMP